MRYPYRIMEETFDSYAFGTASGLTYVMLKGLYKAPKGHRVDAALQSAYKKAPRVAGYAVLVTAVFCTVDHTMEYVRQKNDIWNKVTAGAASAGLFTIRHGLSTPARSVVLCGAFAGICFAITGET